MIVSFTQDHYSSIMAIVQEELPAEIESIKNALTIFLDDKKFLEHQKKSSLLDLWYFVYLKDDIAIALGWLYSIEEDDVFTDRLGRFIIDSRYKKKWIGKEILRYLEELSINRWKVFLQAQVFTDEWIWFLENNWFEKILSDNPDEYLQYYKWVNNN